MFTKSTLNYVEATTYTYWQCRYQPETEVWHTSNTQQVETLPSLPFIKSKTVMTFKISNSNDELWAWLQPDNDVLVLYASHYRSLIGTWSEPRQLSNAEKGSVVKTQVGVLHDGGVLIEWLQSTQPSVAIKRAIYKKINALLKFVTAFPYPMSWTKLSNKE